MVAELRGRGVELPVIAWDSRSHGDSPIVEPPYDWWDFGRDALAVLEDDGRRPIGIGHSCGATALAMAEILKPGVFAGLVLLEPIIFPPPYRRHHDHPLAAGAEKRKESFPSRVEARENFASKEVFAHWDPRALEAYVRGGLEVRDGRYRLKCPPWAEAETYRTATTHGAWERLGEVSAPVLLLAGERSDSHRGPFLQELAARFAQAQAVVVPGAGHFLPMERPDAVALAVAHFLANGLG